MAAVQKCEFTQCVLRGIARTHKGGAAQFSSSLTDALRSKLDLEDLPDYLTEGKSSERELVASQIILRSKDGDLAQYEIIVQAQRVHKFELVRLEREGTKGKGTRTELRFIVKFNDPTGCAFLEEYMVKAGDSKGTLVVSYTAQPEQEELPIADPEAMQRTLQDD